MKVGGSFYLEENLPINYSSNFITVGLFMVYNLSMLFSSIEIKNLNSTN
jgi:hypothetical protein